MSTSTYPLFSFLTRETGNRPLKTALATTISLSLFSIVIESFLHVISRLQKSLPKTNKKFKVHENVST